MQTKNSYLNLSKNILFQKKTSINISQHKAGLLVNMIILRIYVISGHCCLKNYSLSHNGDRGVNKMWQFSVVPWTSPLPYWVLPDWKNLLINGKSLLWLNGGEKFFVSPSLDRSGEVFSQVCSILPEPFLTISVSCSRHFQSSCHRNLSLGFSVCLLLKMFLGVFPF